MKRVLLPRQDRQLSDSANRVSLPQRRPWLSQTAHAMLVYAVVGLAILLYLGNVYRYQYVQWDDAYISFRFAQHLQAGQGLTWNLGGERVEGFTSLLHVLLLAFGMRLGITPESVGIFIGVASVLATVGLLALALRRHLGGFTPGAAAILGLYLIDETTAIHSTSGLETQLFVMLLSGVYLTALAFLDAPGPSGRAALGLSLLTFLSVLGRPEGLLYGATVYGILVLACLRLPRPTGVARLRLLALSMGLLGALGLVYAAWKYQYYGYLLPNPYYIKSGRLSLSGALDVLRFVGHVALWYGPIVLSLALATPVARLAATLRTGQTWAKVALTIAPPLVGLSYYVTIIHEVGGAYRFTYPTYVYLVVAVAVYVSFALSDMYPLRRFSFAIIALPLVYLALINLRPPAWSLTPLPPDPLNEYHFKIGYALQKTGLGARGILLNDAAGIIPYVSGFTQIDRVGLTDNFLSGRHPITREQREDYLWRQGADVYLGVEPPASLGALRAEDDPRMTTAYVATVLMKMPLIGVSDRVYLQEPSLLHARMRELRDNWYWLGEIAWVAEKYWGLKSFLYVRKTSPHMDVLLPALRGLIDNAPEQVSLNNP